MIKQDGCLNKVSLEHLIYANPVILGGLFPNGKYGGMWLPMLNR